MTTTTYLWDTLSDNLLSEDDGSTQTVYTNEPSEFGDLVSQRQDINTNFYHFDARGDTRELTDDSEAITDTRLYDAWGNVVGSTGATEISFQFAGQTGYSIDIRFDVDYGRARFLCPTNGRWMNQDPAGLAAGVNLFAFVDNRPIASIDPSGLAAIDLSLESAKSSACGFSELVWKIRAAGSGSSTTGTSRPPARQAIVQRICLAFGIGLCRRDNADCCEVKKFVHDLCCFTEYLGNVDTRAFGQQSVRKDVWSTPSQGVNDCNSQGTFVIAASVKSFDLKDSKISSDLKQWQANPAPGGPCPGFPFTLNTSSFSKAEPTWFNTKSVDEGTNSMLLFWDCCGDKKQTLYYSVSGFSFMKFEG